MPKQPLADLSVVLAFLRQGQGWSQTELGEMAGVLPSRINDYEKDRKTLHRGRLEYLISFLGLPPERIDETLSCLAANRAASRAPAGPGAHFVQARRRIDRIAVRCGRLAADFGRSVLTLLTVEGEALHSRQRAEMLWGRLKRRTAAERRVLVEDGRDYRSWALCERVAAESLTLAANQPRQALELAELALRIGELAPGEVAWRQRLQGYALFHVANARRVCNDVPAGETALSRAGRLWQEGAPGDPGLLNAAVPLWIEAAFRRDQRRFPEALKRIDEALALDSGELRARMLLSKSAILEILGDSNGATAALAEAAPLIDVAREPRLALVLRFNLLVDLCHLERAAEAAPKLREVRELAEQLGEELDLVRVVWLEGKVAAGLGQSAEARAAFAQARREFRARELAYDYALVSLDLSLVLLTSGRPGDVRRLAEEMVWIFSAQGIHREALAALQVFCTAAREEVATIELTSRVRRFLYRAQHDRELRFGQEEGAASQ